MRFGCVLLLVCLTAQVHAQDSEPPTLERPNPTECNQHTDSAPEGCVCLSEDDVIDAAAELRVHRSEGALSVSWTERVIWLALVAVGIWAL